MTFLVESIDSRELRAPLLSAASQVRLTLTLTVTLTLTLALTLALALTLTPTLTAALGRLAEPQHALRPAAAVLQPPPLDPHVRGMRPTPALAPHPHPHPHPNLNPDP